MDIGTRYSIGVTFIFAGAAKLPMHPEWVKAIAAYRVLPFSLVGPYLSALPWIEIAIGVCLILGFLTRLSALASILMIASFMVGNWIALSYRLPVECGCFGGLVYLDHRGALVMDFLLLVGAVWVFLERRHFMAVGPRLPGLP